MDSLSQLKSILEADSVQQGTVLAVSDNNVTVATPSGSFVAQRQSGDVTDYQLGNAVNIQNGFLIGITVDRSASLRYLIV